VGLVSSVASIEEDADGAEQSPSLASLWVRHFVRINAAIESDVPISGIGPFSVRFDPSMPQKRALRSSWDWCGSAEQRCQSNKICSVLMNVAFCAKFSRIKMIIT
jgi:hypothetical protein